MGAIVLEEIEQCSASAAGGHVSICAVIRAEKGGGAGEGHGGVNEGGEEWGRRRRRVSFEGTTDSNRLGSGTGEGGGTQVVRGRMVALRRPICRRGGGVFIQNFASSRDSGWS